MKKLFTLVLLMVMAMGVAVAQNDSKEESIQVEEAVDVDDFTVHKGGDKEFRIAIDGGYSHRLGKAAEGVSSDFARQLKNGLTLGGDVHYMFKNGMGVGGKFAWKYYGTSSTETIEDKISLIYVAPSFMWNFSKRQSGGWFCEVSVGYLKYNEKVKVMGGSDAIGVDSGTIMATYNIGYDISRSDAVGLGFKLSFNNGVVDLDLRKYGGQNNVKESVSAIELTFGIRF